MAPERPEDVAEVAERLDLTVAPVQLPVQGQALPQGGDRLVPAAQPPMDAAEVVEADRLAPAGAQLPRDGQALPQLAIASS